MSCKDKKLPAPAPEQPYTGPDTTFWSSGEIRIYEGNYHRIDSKHVSTVGPVETYVFHKEWNEHRQYLVKVEDSTIYMTFNKYIQGTTTGLLASQLDAEGYYRPDQFDRYKFSGDTLLIKAAFRYNDYMVGRIIKANVDYKGLLQH